MTYSADEEAYWLDQAQMRHEDHWAKYMLSILEKGGEWGQDDRFTYWVDDSDNWRDEA